MKGRRTKIYMVDMYTGEILGEFQSANKAAAYIKDSQELEQHVESIAAEILRIVNRTVVKRQYYGYLWYKAE